MTSQLEYKGDLKCEAKHSRSGITIITDAPPDNNGKGESFVSYCERMGLNPNQIVGNWDCIDDDDGDKEKFNILWETLYRIPVTEQILDRAAQSFPTVLGSLDAIHLASALAVADPGEESSFTFLTHDIQLARAAMTVGYGIAGI